MRVCALMRSLSVRTTLLCANNPHPPQNQKTNKQKVNNVGTNVRKPAVDYSDAEFDLLLATNVKSAFALCQACHPLLKKAGAASAAGGSGGAASSSSVLFNSSVAGGPTCMRSGAPYGLTKAALNQMARSLAVEWAPDGIRVNSVAPW